MVALRAAPVVGPSGRGSAPPSRPNDLNSTTKITHSIFFYPLRVYFYECSNYICTLAAVECVFAYRCLFPYLQHICSTLTQMACLITVCISRRLSNKAGQLRKNQIRRLPSSMLSSYSFGTRISQLAISII